MSGAVTIAAGVLSVAIEAMAQVRKANAVIDAEGQGQSLDILQLRGRLLDEMSSAADSFEADIEDELIDRKRQETERD